MRCAMCVYVELWYVCPNDIQNVQEIMFVQNKGEKAVSKNDGLKGGLERSVAANK